MKGGGLVVGWGGCECDGLVSNTLSLTMSVTSMHPSMVSHSPVCFKAIVLLPLQSVCFFFFHNQFLWASASEPAGSVPATQSQEREVGTIALWPHARAC